MEEKRFKHIIDIENEAQAARLGGLLEEEEIPHRIVRNYDNVYAGIFIPQYGWGYVEAPEEYRDQIVDLYLDLRDSGHGPVPRDKQPEKDN
ncbi:MAG: hypothetical protein ACLFPW_14805 [Spirochaetaceae bacterium]